MIVGFPGETDEDFAESLTLLDAIQSDGVFAFKYSPRPNTPALAMPDAIPEEEKSRRLAILQERQRQIQIARNEKLDRRASSKSSLTRITPRAISGPDASTSNRIINFSTSRENLLGQYVQVRITRSAPNSLVGEQLS